MSLLDSVFGAGAQSALLGNNIGQTQQQANQAFNAAYNQYQNQQMAQMGQQSLSQAFNQKMSNWNQNPYARPSQWVFNNKPCSLQEFADKIWGEDEHPDKMLFILTHSGPDK